MSDQNNNNNKEVPFEKTFVGNDVQIVGRVCTAKKGLPVEGAVEDLEELVQYLDKNVIPQQDKRFKRGTVTSDARLDLCKQGVGPEGARLVRQHLSKNTTIQHLLMGDDSLGAEGALEVGNIIKENESIKTIYLGCNNIAEEGTRHLVDAILEKNNIKALWIKRNHINQGGASHIGRLMSTNNSIEILDLISNDLCPSSINTITHAISSNPYNQLTTLLLDSNHFGAQGAQKLVDNLFNGQSNIKLLFLSLSNCNLLDEGCRIICESFKKQTTIIDFDISSNKLTSVSAKYIGDMIETDRTLQNLEIGHSGKTNVVGGEHNLFGPEGITYILNKVGESKHPSLRSIDITFGSGHELNQTQKQTVLAVIQNKEYPISRIEGLLRLVGQDTIQFKRSLKDKNSFWKSKRNEERKRKGQQTAKVTTGKKEEETDRDLVTDGFIKPIISVYRVAKKSSTENPQDSSSSSENTVADAVVDKEQMEKNDQKELQQIFNDHHIDDQTSSSSSSSSSSIPLHQQQFVFTF